MCAAQRPPCKKSPFGDFFYLPADCDYPICHAILKPGVVKNPMKLIIFASGRGSNAHAIIRATQNGRLGNVRVLSLVSDNPDAPALKIARDFGCKAEYIDPGRTGARFTPDGAKRYADRIARSGVDLVVLSGFQRILPPELVSELKGRAINLHPSLLPDFKGKDAIRRAYESGAKRCGCTVHYVSDELDGGEIIAQSAVEITDGITLEELEAKVHEAEHELLPRVIAKISSKNAE